MTGLHRIFRIVPTFLLAIALAGAVWISAVTAADPTQERVYPAPVPLEVIGQDPGLIVTSELPNEVSVTLKAPRSVWDSLTNDSHSVRAVIDLSGHGTGQHTIPVQVQVSLRPYKVISVTPVTVQVALDVFASQRIPVHLILRGDPDIGYQAGTSQVSAAEVVVSGPQSLVKRVADIRTILDLAQAHSDIHQTLTLQALDADGIPITGVTLNPDRITVTLPIIQRGGYRNVVIKVVVTGQVASGYRLTNISAFPPAVTVFSSDPQAVELLPGFIESKPIDLTGAKDDLDLQVALNLPGNIAIVGGDTVNVQVGIAAIEGSLTLSNMHVQVTGLLPGQIAVISPERVDVILSGPLNLLDSLLASQVHVIVDLTGKDPGKYQITPQVVVDLKELTVESILPGTIEVQVSEATPTPTPTATPTTTPTPFATRRP